MRQVYGLLPGSRRAPPTPQVQSPDGIELTALVPCFNEVRAIEATVTKLDRMLGEQLPPMDYELIVVDDGSTDGSAEVLRALAARMPRLIILTHMRNSGYGAALKTGLARARGGRVAIVDADGSYPLERLPDLLQVPADMVVGARPPDAIARSPIRALTKRFLRAYAQWVTREPIPDINSGMRVFSRDLALAHLHIVPDGFSFTTTITMAAMMDHAEVAFLPISYHPRIGTSKIMPVRDTLRFVALIIRTGMYFVPLRILSPLVGIAWLALFASLARDLFWKGDLGELTLMLVTVALNLSVLALIADMLRRRTQR